MLLQFPSLPVVHHRRALCLFVFCVIQTAQEMMIFSVKGQISVESCIVVYVLSLHTCYDNSVGLVQCLSVLL